jgi:hypothetical protein
MATEDLNKPGLGESLNRREVIKRGIVGALGIGAVVVGGAAAKDYLNNSGGNENNGGALPGVAGTPQASPTGAKTPESTVGVSPTTVINTPTPIESTPTVITTPEPTVAPTEPPATEVASPIATTESTNLDWEKMSPQEMKERVGKNIEAFMNLPADKLVTMIQGAKFGIQYQYGLVESPIFNDTSSKVDAYLGKPNDPKHPFPCTTFITDVPVTLAEGDSVTLYATGVNLGEQVVKVSTSMGELNMRIGIMGYVAGDPDSKTDLLRTTYPVFYGWDADETKGVNATKPAYTASKVNASQDILYPLVPTPGPTFSEEMTGLGTHIADGVLVNQLGQSLTPSPSLQQQLGAKGFPPELFDNWLSANYSAIGKYKQILSALTLDKAKEDGFVLYDAGSSQTTQEDIPDLKQGKSREQLIKELPFSGQPITVDTMTLDELSQIPLTTCQWLYITSDPLIK